MMKMLRAGFDTGSGSASLTPPLTSGLPLVRPERRVLMQRPVYEDQACPSTLPQRESL